MAAKKSFLLRIDPALWSELEAWAAAEFRSVNGQIEYILHQAAAKRRGGAAQRKPPDPEGAPSRDQQ
ncbi:MAG: Arc family DNA-binding protein [Planctomycetota bacterium]